MMANYLRRRFFIQSLLPFVFGIPEACLEFFSIRASITPPPMKIDKGVGGRFQVSQNWVLLRRRRRKDEDGPMGMEGRRELWGQAFRSVPKTAPSLPRLPKKATRRKKQTVIHGIHNRARPTKLGPNSRKCLTGRLALRPQSLVIG